VDAQYYNEPFDHWVIDNFFPESVAKELAEDFVDFDHKDWYTYDNPLEVKKTLNNWWNFPAVTYNMISYFNSAPFVKQIEHTADVYTCTHTCTYTHTHTHTRIHTHINTHRFGGTPMDDAVRHGQVGIQTILRENGALLTEVEMGVKMCTAAADADVEALQVFHVYYIRVYSYTTHI
jgi:hypothetical protein